MRSAILLLAFSTGALAEDFEKPCILAAAEHLPRIPGIEIKASRTEPVPPAMAAPLKAALFSALVHIDTRAAGQDATFNFVCAIGKNTPIVVTPYR